MNNTEEDLREVSGFKSKSEKLSWKRKQVKIQKIIDEKLNPIQEKILALNLKKQPIMDEIAKVRDAMVKTCIHPHEFLEHHDTYVECKFCYNKIKLSEYDNGE